MYWIQAWFDKQNFVHFTITLHVIYSEIALVDVFEATQMMD